MFLNIFSVLFLFFFFFLLIGLLRFSLNPCYCEIMARNDSWILYTSLHTSRRHVCISRFISSFCFCTFPYCNRDSPTIIVIRVQEKEADRCTMLRLRFHRSLFFFFTFIFSIKLVVIWFYLQWSWIKDPFSVRSTLQSTF